MTVVIDIPKQYEAACQQAGDLLFIPAGLLTYLDVGEPIGRFVHVYDCDWTVVQQDAQHDGWYAKQGQITRNTFINSGEDKHAQDGQTISLFLTLAIGPLRIWPLELSLGRKLQLISILRVGRVNGWRKPSALLGMMHWDGNGKRMWSVDLCYVGYDWIKGRGIDASYLR